MTKWLSALGVCLALGIASADTPTPPQGQGSGAGSAANSTSEKAGTNESLQNGGDTRPWAAGVSQAEQKQALQLFHDGNVQLNDGLFAKAAEKYREALKHWDHPAIHYNLALALLNLSQPIDAYENMQAALKYGEPPLQSKDKFDNAKQYVLLLEKQIAEVSVSCDKPGAKVTVDGKEAFVAPGKFSEKVEVGKHTFVAEKQGYTTHINAPYIGPGEKFRIELKLYTADELTRYHRKWDATWMPWAVMGAGAAIAIGGGVFELSASSSYSDYDKQVAACNMNNQGCQSTKALTDLKSSGDTKKTIGFVGYGIGAATIVVGAALAYINRPEAYEIRAEDLDKEHVSVAPVVAPGYTGAALQGHF
jgi:tetratricopeptide (TPR) repeat protein